MRTLNQQELTTVSGASGCLAALMMACAKKHGGAKMPKPVCVPKPVHVSHGHCGTKPAAPETDTDPVVGDEAA